MNKSAALEYFQEIIEEQNGIFFPEKEEIIVIKKPRIVVKAEKAIKKSGASLDNLFKHHDNGAFQKKKRRAHGEILRNERILESVSKNPEVLRS